MTTTDTRYTVRPWQGGHANVGHAAPVSTAPMTPLAPGRGTVRYSVDGTWRYVRDGRIAVQYQPTGEWMWDEQFDSMHLGFGSLVEARRYTAAVDVQAAADSVGFDGPDPNCICPAGRPCLCTSDSIDYER